MRVDTPNFTMVLDVLVEKYGITVALVFGAISRFAESSGICFASQKKIATRIGLSVKTVYRAEKILEENGLIKAVNRENGETIRYRINKEIVFKMQAELEDVEREETFSIKADLVPLENEIAILTLSTSDPSDSVSDPSDIESDPSVMESDKDTINIQINKHVNRNKIAETSSSPPALVYEECDEDGLPVVRRKKKQKRKEKVAPPDLFLLASALSEVTGMPFSINRGRLFNEAKLIKSEEWITPDLIRQIYREGGAWYREDWRGKRGQKPRLHEIRETIATLSAEKEKKIDWGGYG